MLPHCLLIMDSSSITCVLYSTAFSTPLSKIHGFSVLYRTKNKPVASSEGYCSEVTLSSKEVSCQEDTVLDSGVLEFSKKRPRPPLPPPGQLGGGNPFMMFLCLTLLLQHRDVIMRNRMDYNELAMHFDKMIRKHNVHKVLQETRFRFDEYIRMGWDSSTEQNV